MSVNDIKCTSDCDFQFERNFVPCESEDFVFQLAQMCKEKARLDKSIIVVRALKGDKDSHQQGYLRLAKNYMNEHHRLLYGLLKFEELNNDELKEMHWVQRPQFNWLIDSDIHLVLTYVHQGLMGISSRNKVDIWSIYRIEYNFWRLTFHRGFPNGVSNIFKQDKWNYLLAVKNRVLPTLKVPLTVNLDDNSIIEKIIRQVL